MSSALALQPSDMMTTTAVAAELGVSREAVYYWWNCGKIHGELVTARLLLVSITDARREEKRTRNSRNKRKQTLSLST
jgi:hypothetical protein